VIGLARGLELPVTAEGVETRAQLEVLTRAGCDFVQGFLIGVPGSIDGYAEIVGRPRLERLSQSAEWLQSGELDEEMKRCNSNQF